MQSLFMRQMLPGAPLPDAVHSPTCLLQFTWQVIPAPHVGLTGSHPGKICPPPPSPTPPSGSGQLATAASATIAGVTMARLTVPGPSPTPTTQPCARACTWNETSPSSLLPKLTDSVVAVT